MLIVYLGDFPTKILKLLNKNKITYKRIGKLDLEQTVEDCFNQQKSETGKGNCYICSDSQEEAFQTMRFFKQNGIQNVRISIKTEVNKKWKIHDWMKELDEEYEYFSTRDLLKQALQKAGWLKNKNLNETLVFTKAKKVYEDNEAEVEDLKQALLLMKQTFK